MTSSLDDIPLPTGWERKFDTASARTYYIDHARRVTQWDDPRLRHPSIWREQQRQMLERMQIIFKDAPEDTLRQALVTNRFMEFNAINHVANLGYKKSATIVVGQPSGPGSSSGATAGSAYLPPPPSGQANLSANPVANGDTSAARQTRRRSSPKPKTTTSPKPRTRTGSNLESSNRSSGVDPFNLLTMKSRFPETAEDVIVDVLNQCGQNVDMATRELNNMGYAGRQKATERNIEREFKTGDLEKEKQRKVKEEREQNLRQLKNEFEAFLDADIASAFESCSYDMHEARSALRRREADLRIQALSASEVKATAIVPVVTVQEGITTTTIGDTTVTIERRRLESADAAENVLKETVIIKPAGAMKALKQAEKRMKLPNVDAMIRSHESVSKSTGATPSHHAGGAWASLAKGPNPSLRHGSDPNLRSGASRALGPDPSLRRGPNPEFRQSNTGRQVAVM